MAITPGNNASKNMKVIGLIPAAGKASRLNPIPCSKELIPIGVGNIKKAEHRPKVVTHYLLEKYRYAGVKKVYFILRSGKWDIPAYFGDGKMMDMNFAYLLMNLPYGVPFTCNQAYEFIKGAKVMMGFPDILFGPDDAFVQADAALARNNGDIVIGLFPAKNRRQAMKCDMVQWDSSTARINKVFIKPEKTELKYSWIFAIWTPVFTEFMHDYLKQIEKDYLSGSIHKEIYLGDIVQSAIDEGLNVIGHAFKDNTFIDIGTPDELIEAYKEYTNIEGL